MARCHWWWRGGFCCRRGRLRYLGQRPEGRMVSDRPQVDDLRCVWWVLGLLAGAVVALRDEPLEATQPRLELAFIVPRSVESLSGRRPAGGRQRQGRSGHSVITGYADALRARHECSFQGAGIRRLPSWPHDLNGQRGGCSMLSVSGFDDTEDRPPPETFLCPARRRRGPATFYPDAGRGEGSIVRRTLAALPKVCRRARPHSSSKASSTCRTCSCIALAHSRSCR